MFLKPPSFNLTANVLLLLLLIFSPMFTQRALRVERFRSLDFSLKFLLITPSKPVNAMRLPNLDHVRDAMSNYVSRCLFCFFSNSLSRSPVTPTTMVHHSMFSPGVSFWLFIQFYFITAVLIQISITGSQHVQHESLSLAGWFPPCHRGRSRPRTSWGEGRLQCCR
ncbi:uncharacterized protein BDZ83DRAFT_611133 [Colletotrichum acutatum]|uniref:Uncharacterized protein n=1 Tax=Glomerella acutata TaxID=27357 RepID=A0AAD8UPY3_GLOAC|nr:uncharacterized protein BDZ83DRAFT_611133 [Colletotrichum acutatum]KAK1727806.1 hypothetical protein BDZ83DRAFT_611133 [Colletotrichum acutatum]